MPKTATTVAEPAVEPAPGIRTALRALVLSASHKQRANALGTRPRRL
jgi:hypothetical protein